MQGIKNIKNYRLTKELGRGVIGVVYEAVDDVTNKLYAVKAIPFEKLKEPRVMENFKRELKLLDNLNHNNIIKIERVEKTVNNAYLILEYCNGGNLYEYALYFRKTSNQPMPERYVQAILRQLIEGLEYMHNLKIVHRDIKLENILVNFSSVSNTVGTGGMPQKIDYSKMKIEDITIKIADLGYSRELDGFGVASTLCGTPLTLAPEIIEIMKKTGKHQSYNNRVDLWSLGAITYELLIGRPPFCASHFEQLFKDVLNGIYNLPKNIKLSIEAITFLNGLLQFNPEKRMTWKEIKSHPFIVKDISTFNVIDLETVENNYENPEQLEVDTKDCENFIWILFKNNLDKLDHSACSNPIIIDQKKKNEEEGKDPLDKEKQPTEEIKKQQAVDDKPQLGQEEPINNPAKNGISNLNGKSTSCDGDLIPLPVDNQKKDDESWVIVSTHSANVSFDVTRKTYVFLNEYFNN